MGRKELKTHSRADEDHAHEVPRAQEDPPGIDQDCPIEAGHEITSVFGLTGDGLGLYKTLGRDNKALVTGCAFGLPSAVLAVKGNDRTTIWAVELNHNSVASSR